MLLDSKIFEYIIPDSETDSQAEAYEYFLVWQGSDGGVYFWMFEDFTQKKQVNGSIINSVSDNITKIFFDSKNVVTLTAEDLTENQFDVISNIIHSKIIRRYYKDGTYTNLAIVTDQIIKRKSQFRYVFEIDVQEIDNYILK